MSGRKTRSMKEKGYVQMWLKKETRDAITNLKRGNDTYDDVIQHCISCYRAVTMEDHAAQNVDDTRGEDELD